jgi:phosphate ABC transporter permease protein PstC
VATATTVTGGRSGLERSPLSRLPDRALKYGLISVAVLVLALIVFFFIRLIGESTNALSTFGLKFIFVDNWNIPQNIYEALALVVGTIITSAMALVLGVPVAVATALFLTETCPVRLRKPLGGVIDLLAAVPSVVYGLWGFIVLGPKLVPVETWISNTFSFIPFIGPPPNGTVPIGNYFIAGLILAIMILPIVSAISREVLSTVPTDNKEAALALGATRWEMIRIAVLPYARSGITGGAMLGLGRAIGETIAVVTVIGNAPVIGKTLFSQGYTLAAVIANEFGEATGLHRSALFACGLVLFVLTLIVNLIARMIVLRTGRPRGGGVPAGDGRKGGGTEPVADAAVSSA